MRLGKHADSKLPILFLHIPKNAGSSVGRMLSSRFPTDKQVILKWGDEQLVTSESLNRYDYLVGHVCYGIKKRFHRKPYVMTFLREPIDRALSNYYYMANYPDLDNGWLPRTRALRALQSMSLSDFIDQEPRAAAVLFGNCQTMYLTGEQPFLTRYQNVDKQTLEIAKHNLDSCDLVGLSSEMFNSLALLSYDLGWTSFGEQAHDNRTPTRPRDVDLDAETHEKLLQITQYDRELYRYGSELFKQRLEQMVAVLLKENARLLNPKPDVPASVEYTFDQPAPHTGWYAVETVNGNFCRWSGPATESWIEVEISDKRDLVFNCRVVGFGTPEILSTMRVLINGNALETGCTRLENGEHELTATVPRSFVTGVNGVARVSFAVAETVRFCDLYPGNTDIRQVGVLVGPIKLTPLRTSAIAVTRKLLAAR